MKKSAKYKNDNIISSEHFSKEILDDFIRNVIAEDYVNKRHKNLA
jgi:hypothetical protein